MRISTNFARECPKEFAYNVQSISQALETWATKQPDRIAYRFLSDGERDQKITTYSELVSRVRTIASAVSHWKAERALLLFNSGPEFLEAFLGCLYAGVIAVPAHPPRKNRGVDRLMAIFKDCTPQVIVTTHSIRHFAEPLFGTVEDSASQWLRKNVKWICTDSIPTSGFEVRPPAPHDLA